MIFLCSCRVDCRIFGNHIKYVCNCQVYDCAIDSKSEHSDSFIQITRSIFFFRK